MSRSLTAVSKQLNEVGERIKERKQSDLRFCFGVAKEALGVIRAYQTAKKNGLKRDSVEKVDAAIEKLLSE